MLLKDLLGLSDIIMIFSSRKTNACDSNEKHNMKLSQWERCVDGGQSVVRCGSDVWSVQVGAVDAPVRGEVLHCVDFDVSLHGDQAAAELQAHSALVGSGPAMRPQVLDHGWVVPWALTTETTLEGFLPLKQRQESGGQSREDSGGWEEGVFTLEGLSYLYTWKVCIFMSVSQTAIDSCCYIFWFSKSKCVIWGEINQTAPPDLHLNSYTFYDGMLTSKKKQKQKKTE